MTGSERHRAAAEEALGATRVIGAKFPRAAGWGLAASSALMAGPAEIAIVGDSPALVRAARMSTSPGAVVAATADGDAWAPLLRDRGLVEGSPAAYVCRRFVCERPVTTADELVAVLG